jgi:nicotinamidase-related amidase
MIMHESSNGSRLAIPIRYYQFARLYGPGMPPHGTEGLHEKLLEKPPSQIGVVAVHCWNLGEPSGPFPIGPDAHCPGEAADWVPTAHEIITERINPLLGVARNVGVSVFHLAAKAYADRYPQYRKIAADPELQPSTPQEDLIAGSVRPVSETARHQELLGRDFPGAVWETHSEIFDISQSVKPLSDDYVFLNGWQLNGLCRRLDIDTLFYCGFMANICLLEIPGALREMATRFNYQCVVLRDCTTAYECADTVDGNWMTSAAIRVIEQGLGYSASSRDFIAAAERYQHDRNRKRNMQKT